MPTNIPSMRSLMDDPAFRSYMKRIPAPHPANRHGEPWQLWVETSDHKWRTKAFASYPLVWSPFIKYFRDHTATHDVTITSRRVFYAPPGEWYRVKVRDKSLQGSHIEHRWKQTFFWDGADLHWCGRCRRPSYWMPLFPNHHALRRLPAVSAEDNFRCIICGVRWISTPSIENMTKMEKVPGSAV